VVGFSAPIAAASIAFGKYAGVVVPEVPGQAAAVGLVVLATALHMADVVLGSRVQNVLAALKATLILVFIGAGLLVGSGYWSNLDTALPEASGSIWTPAFWSSLVYVSFSYSGWNAAAYVAGELDQPGRNLPRALLMGTAIVTVLYLGLNLVFLYAAPAAALAGKNEVGAVAAGHLFGERAARWLSTLISLGLMSSVSAMVMAGPRVYTAMAEDGLFFRSLAWRNKRGAPAASVLLQGGLAVLFVFLVPFDKLIQYIGFTLSIFAALAVLGAGVLRARHAGSSGPGLGSRLRALARAFVTRAGQDDRTRPYRTFGWPVTPLLFLALSTWMAVFLVRERPVPSLLYGGSTIVMGLVVYVLWHRLRGAGQAP
jgi:APA family basic amino acid/polyamine antiporter